MFLFCAIKAWLLFDEAQGLRGNSVNYLNYLISAQDWQTGTPNYWTIENGWENNTLWQRKNTLIDLITISITWTRCFVVNGKPYVIFVMTRLAWLCAMTFMTFMSFMTFMTFMTHRNVVFDIPEPPAFQKYNTCWVLWAFIFKRDDLHYIHDTRECHNGYPWIPCCSKI